MLITLNFVFSLEFVEPQKLPKDLLLRGQHVRSHVGDDDWLGKVAVELANAVFTAKNLCTLSFGVADVIFYLL